MAAPTSSSPENVLIPPARVPVRERGLNEEELRALLQEEYPRAYRSARMVLRNSADAEEAVQEAFLRLWRFRDAIPTGVGQRGWVYRVVVNAATSKLRTDRRWNQRVDGESAERVLDHLEAAESGPGEKLESHETHEELWNALGELPDHLRVTVVLRYYTQLSEAEIATAIGKKPGTVKSRLHEARNQLRTNSRVLALWEDARGNEMPTPLGVSTEAVLPATLPTATLPTAAPKEQR